MPQQMIKQLCAVLIALFASFLAGAGTPESDSVELTTDIITDYPVSVERITVHSRSSTSDPSKSAIELFVSGTIQKNGRTQRVSGMVNGVSLPYAETTSAREYQSLLRIDDRIATDRSKQELASIGSNEEVVTDLDWQWTITYREYRYTIKDRLAALMFGIWVKNTQFISINVDPR